jgi:cell division protein ZapA
MARLLGSAGRWGKGGEMSQVAVTVNGRPYKIACDDGQEPRIRRLAQYVDARVGEFVKTVGQVGEARLLLLAALVIADELSDANEALQQEQSRYRAAESEAGDTADAAANGIHGIAQRLEALAGRLESP